MTGRSKIFFFFFFANRYSLTRLKFLIIDIIRKMLNEVGQIESVKMEEFWRLRECDYITEFFELRRLHKHEVQSVEEYHLSQQILLKKTLFS